MLGRDPAERAPLQWLDGPLLLLLGVLAGFLARGCMGHP